MAEFNLMGIKIYSVKERWLSELYGNLSKVSPPWNRIVEKMIYESMIEIYGWMAEEKSKRKGERVRIGNGKLNS